MDLREIKNDYTPKILQGLYDNTFNGLDNVKDAWTVIRVLYNVDILLSISDVDIDMDARMDFIVDQTTSAISEFYQVNPELLDDSFSLNDYYYNTNLRALIISIEETLKSDKQYDEE
jgi:hypothetical protein